MTADSVRRSLEASGAWLAAQDSPESVIAAHETATADSADPARRWVRRILDEQDQKGSWGSDLLETAGALLTIRELREAAALVERDPAVNIALDWLRGRQNAPGTWTEGCTPDRHDHGACHHFMAGFFSPAPPEVTLEEAWLRGGLRLVGDGEIRFVASAVALRCAMLWELDGVDLRLHLSGLRRLVAQWPDYVPPGLSTGSLLAAVHALLVSEEEEDRTVAEGGLRAVAARQRGDGSWVDADAFQALEVFGTALDRGVSDERSRRALWHGARLLIASQQADGSWGKAHGARRALIAWRTFRRLEPVRE